MPPFGDVVLVEVSTIHHRFFVVLSFDGPVDVVGMTIGRQNILRPIPNSWSYVVLLFHEVFGGTPTVFALWKVQAKQRVKLEVSAVCLSSRALRSHPRLNSLVHLNFIALHRLLIVLHEGHGCVKIRHAVAIFDYRVVEFGNGIFRFLLSVFTDFVPERIRNLHFVRHPCQSVLRLLVEMQHVVRIRGCRFP